MGLTDVAVIAVVDSLPEHSGLRSLDLRRDAMDALAAADLLADSLASLTGGVLVLEVDVGQSYEPGVHSFLLRVRLLQRAILNRVEGYSQAHDLDMLQCLLARPQFEGMLATWESSSFGNVEDGSWWTLREPALRHVRSFVLDHQRANPGAGAFRQ